MKIITILGARPQFVKAAALSRVIAQYDDMQEIIVHTGQHYDKNMSDVFFREMSIPDPVYYLGINGKTHGAMTGQMLEKIEEVLLKEKPDAVLVYGDTNSTLAGAISARKLNIPLIHVEAGLRSFRMEMPEEINRILTDRISDLLFCPTDSSFKNLCSEGFANFNSKIFISGDVMYDVALFFEKISDKQVDIREITKEKDFVLATIHRAENTDNLKNLESILSALNEIAGNIEVVLPIHPRTKRIILENGLASNFKIIEPVGYLEMIQLIKNSLLVMTDSGGLQKEAYFFKKNCITLRKETEWTELVDHGYNYIAGNECKSILSAYETMRCRNNNFDENLYGNGSASEFIVEKIRSYI